MSQSTTLQWGIISCFTLPFLDICCCVRLHINLLKESGRVTQVMKRNRFCGHVVNCCALFSYFEINTFCSLACVRWPSDRRYTVIRESTISAQLHFFEAYIVQRAKPCQKLWIRFAGGAEAKSSLHRVHPKSLPWILAHQLSLNTSCMLDMTLIKARLQDCLCRGLLGYRHQISGRLWNVKGSRQAHYCKLTFIYKKLIHLQT